MQLIRKCKITLTGPQLVIDTPYTIDNVKAIKVRWLYYQTVTTGNKELVLRLREFGENGLILEPSGGNAKYFFSMPLDTSDFVTCTYSNYTSEMDLIMDNPERAINQLTFDVLINGVQANDITVGNPLVMEIGFYN